MQRKAVVLDTRGRVLRTPPGSKSGACMQRGHSGTWERHLSPYVYCRTGGPGDLKALAWLGGFAQTTSLSGTPRTHRSREGSGPRAPSDAFRAGQGGSLSGAEDRGRWGSEAHAPHGRAGDAGHHVELASPQSLYRTRINGIDERRAKPSSEMGAPPPNLARPGRMNPLGTPSCMSRWIKQPQSLKYDHG